MIARDISPVAMFMTTMMKMVVAHAVLCENEADADEV